MKIVKIDWLDEDSKEGELTISDGNFACTAFSHPCEYKEGDVLKEPIWGMDVKELMLALDESISIIKRNGSSFIHKIHGQIIDVDESLIAIEGIIIKLQTYIPSWAKKGDYVEFTSYLVVI